MDNQKAKDIIEQVNKLYPNNCLTYAGALACANEASVHSALAIANHIADGCVMPKINRKKKVTVGKNILTKLKNSLVQNNLDYSKSEIERFIHSDGALSKREIEVILRTIISDKNYSNIGSAFCLLVNDKETFIEKLCYYLGESYTNGARPTSRDSKINWAI